MAGTRVLCPKHPKHSKERSYSSLPLGQWDSETRPFCCSDKTFMLNPDHYGVLFSTFFVCLGVFLGNWAGFDHYSSHVPGLNAKYGQQMTWLKILPQPTHDMYIHNILNLFMISINASFRLEQLIQWKYVQIICSTVIYHSSQMSEMNIDYIRFGPACVIYSKAPIH